jgi:hypothetical protein
MFDGQKLFAVNLGEIVLLLVTDFFSSVISMQEEKRPDFQLLSY